MCTYVYSLIVDMARYAPHRHFQLVQGSFEELSIYRTSKKILEHYFCPTCGVAFVIKGAILIAANVRTIDGIDLKKLRFRLLDYGSLP